MSLSFFKVFVWAVFPPPAFLLVLLMIPLPEVVNVAIIGLCDALLFLRPHPYIPLTLFWLCLGVSFLTLLNAWQTVNARYEVYTAAKLAGGNPSDSLIKLLAAERNAWVTGSACVLWIVLHRYRNLMKQRNALRVQLDAATKAK